jgi:hypothetical protein
MSGKLEVVCAVDALVAQEDVGVAAVVLDVDSRIQQIRDKIAAKVLCCAVCGM